MVESVALNSGCSSGIVKTIKSHAYDVLLFYKFPPTMIAPETGHGTVSHTKQKPRAISITKDTRGSKFATDKLIEIKIHNFQLFTSFESIQSHSWRGGACEEQVTGGN